MTLKNIWSYLMNGDNSFTVLQNTEEIDISGVFDDDATNVLKNPALLTVNPFDDEVDKTSDIKIMFKSGEIKTIKAWQAMVRCYVVIKVFDTGTTVAKDQLKLNR